MDTEFEKYVQLKLEEDQEMLKDIPYTNEQLREMYRSTFEHEKNFPDLELKLESQPLQYEVAKYYLPEKWEMPRKGKLLYSDQELQRVMKLLFYNLGVEKALDMIPNQIIKEYLNTKKD